MRILHVTPYWADAWAYGGIPRVAGALVRGLAGAGHRVTVCTTDVHSRDSRRPVDLEAPEPGGIDLRVFRNRSNRLAFDWQCYTPVGLGRYLRDHAHEFDVAHIHACRNLPGVIAAHYLHRYGVPYVIQPNGTAPIIERRHAAKTLFDLVAGSRMFRKAAAVVAVSEAERRQLLALGVPAGRIQVVPNPIDLGEFDPPIDRGRFRACAGLASGPLVAFLGKVTPRKRVDLLVRAFAGLTPDARLVIAGSDMGGLRDARALVQSLGLGDRVLFTGTLEGRARLELLADADVVVYPSEHEIFGLVAAESILAGTPVIVANDSGCGEIVGSAGGGLVVPAGDAGELSHAMYEVLADDAQWRDRTSVAAARVRAEFGAATVVEKLEGVYDTVAASPGLKARPPLGQLRPTHTPARPARSGVSFVVPVKNGLPRLARTLDAIEAEVRNGGRETEIIVIDDRSDDGSAEWLAERAREGRIRFVRGEGRGTSAALNLGVRIAEHPIMCQVDQDVELLPGWMSKLVGELDADPDLAAVEGQYTVDPSAPILARVMAIDLEQRYQSIDRATDHVCTGNTAFRVEALRAIGGFDETLGYGNDVDVSRRLVAAGWRLAHCRQARSRHAWRTDLLAYMRQQYGFGYGRLQVVSRDRGGLLGDRVSPSPMMAHPILMLIALLILPVSPAAGASFIAGLMIERSIAGLRAFLRFGHAASLLFPVVHTIRDLSWVMAIVIWSARTLARRPSEPGHSMRPRPVAETENDRGRETVPAGRVPSATRPIAVIPCHNEAATVASVIADLRDECPSLDIVVVDDGSTDGSADLAARAGAHVIEFPARMGVGTAVRAGLRYARRAGYDAAIRLDADGQHCASDVESLLAPVLSGSADAVLGSRFLETDRDQRTPLRAIQRALAACLSLLTKGRVTDPTSGFCAFGPRALRLLSDLHPAGYAEAETRLLLSRHALMVIELPIESRPRLGGRTSLTVSRVALTGARVVLAMLVFSLRRGSGSDRA